MGVRLIVSTLASVVVLLVGLSSSRAQTRVAGERPPCVRVSTNARFDGVGYGHWVSLDNGCDTAVECDVSTDVAPTNVHVSLARGQHRDVNTFLSSPAREFAATVTCR